MYAMAFYADIKKSKIIKFAGIFVYLEIISSLLRLRKTNTTCFAIYTDYNFEIFICVGV